MDLKLVKKIQNDELYYLVSDNTKADTYYDFYTFPDYKDLKLLESIYYKIIATDLKEVYKNENYNSENFKHILFLAHNIIIDGKVLDITSDKNIVKLIDNIRYKDLYNVINSFRKPISFEVLDFFRDLVLKIKVEQLPRDTQEYFNSFCKINKYTGDRDKLFREILYLATSEEYKRAYARVKAEQDKLAEFDKKVASGEIDISDVEPED